LAQEIGGSGGAIGGCSGSSLLDGGLAVRAALEAIRVGAFVVDIMDVGDGDLDARLGRADELAAVLEDLTEALDVGIDVIGGDASIKLLVVLAQGVSASI